MNINIKETLDQLSIDSSIVDVVDVINNDTYFTFILKSSLEFQVSLDVEDIIFN